jgi:hypothetical protein
MRHHPAKKSSPMHSAPDSRAPSSEGRPGNTANPGLIASLREFQEARRSVKAAHDAWSAAQLSAQRKREHPGAKS